MDMTKLSKTVQSGNLLSKFLRIIISYTFVRVMRELYDSSAYDTMTDAVGRHSIFTHYSCLCV